jgi:uncharacterized protein (DUF2267 family)
MSAVGLEGLDVAVQQAHVWINDLDRRLEWQNKARAYRLLKAVLHALRDHLPVNEAANLGAQLPTLIRGVYYDQWRPATTPLKERHLDQFVATVEKAFKKDPLGDPAGEIAAVFALLSDKVSAGEIADVRQSLPGEIRSLWDRTLVVEPR